MDKLVAAGPRQLANMETITFGPGRLLKFELAMD
jgi:hypothetical protein